jgi:ribonuclease HII
MARKVKSSCHDRFHFERALVAQKIHRIAGVDEAGRGPLAGPVTAAAVVLPLSWLQLGMPEELRDLNDSKQLTAAERDRCFLLLTSDPRIQWQVASLDAERVDVLNILQATHEAMRQAVAALHPPPQHILLDGCPVPFPELRVTSIVAGDSLSYSIAAASVLAKVSRDRVMLEFDRLYPGYGFADHKGYATPEHIAALRRLGPSPIHRRSFSPLKPIQTELFDHVVLAPTQGRS